MQTLFIGALLPPLQSDPEKIHHALSSLSHRAEESRPRNFSGPLFGTMQPGQLTPTKLAKKEKEGPVAEKRLARCGRCTNCKAQVSRRRRLTPKFRTPVPEAAWVGCARAEGGLSAVSGCQHHKHTAAASCATRALA